MSRIQQFPDKIYQGLSTSVRRLVNRIGNQSSCAAICRVNQQQISTYGSNSNEAHAPIDVVADLEHDLGDPIVTRELATIAGYVLVKKPDVQVGDNWNLEIAKLSMEFGEAVAKVSEALADDGLIDKDEAEKLRLREEFRDVMERAAVIDLMLAHAEGDD